MNDAFNNELLSYRAKLIHLHMAIKPKWLYATETLNMAVEKVDTKISERNRVNFHEGSGGQKSNIEKCDYKQIIISAGSMSHLISEEKKIVVLKTFTENW